MINVLTFEKKPELYKSFDYIQERIYLKCGGVCVYSVNNVRSYIWIDYKNGTTMGLIQSRFVISSTIVYYVIGIFKGRL